MNAEITSLLESLTWSLTEKTFPVGTVRKWRGGDFMKYAAGDWRAVKKGAGGRWERDYDAKQQTPAASPPIVLNVDPKKDSDGDGVADAARVGIAGTAVLPPPAIPRLPNLDSRERELEVKFNTELESRTDEMVGDIYERSKQNNYIFETDAAKSLMSEWSRPDLPPDEEVRDESGKVVGTKLHPERFAFRARYNTPLHQAANAVTKKAFLKRLDEIAQMPEDKRRILVTSGGCAAGKGGALKADPTLAQGVAATWDAAGEQNATENPWLMSECEKRGIRPTFLFVHADPDESFKGAIERAKKQGRMVDARVFADSYAEGAKNFASFSDRNRGKADFVFARSAKKGRPSEFLTEMPSEARGLDADRIYQNALQYLDANKDSIPKPVYEGATAGRRIWQKKGK